MAPAGNGLEWIGYFLSPAPLVVANFVSLVSVQARKARSRRCSSSPHKTFGFAGAPLGSTGSGFLLRGGGAAGSGRLGGFVGSAAGGGSLDGLIGSAASSTAGGSRLVLSPSSKIRECHDHVLLYGFRERFASCIFHCTDISAPRKYALFYGDTHLFVTT